MGFFPVHSERTSATPLKSDLLQWCPSMDLLASVTDTDEIHLHRLDGIRVWATAASELHSTASITSLAWRPDGKVLVAGLSHGGVRYVGVNDGKLVSNLSEQGDAQENAIVHLAWLESVMHSSNTIPKVSLDIRRALPHLPPLLSASALDERSFTSKSTIESVIHDLEKHTDSISFVVACDSALRLKLILGALNISVSSPVSQEATLLHFASSQDLTAHALLYTTIEGAWLNLYQMTAFQHLDDSLRELVNTFNDFHAVAQYLKESLSCLAEEWATVELARRQAYTALVDAVSADESGNEARETAARHSLFALLLTGKTDDLTALWFEEIISVRVVKRWEKACAASLVAMRNLVFESCIPACERLVIMLDRLCSASREKASQQETALGTAAVERTIKVVSFLIAQLHMLLRAITTELTTFSAFCGWLGFMIDRLSPDDDYPDTPMPEPIGRVADYIKRHFPRSQVSAFFDTASESHSVYKLTMPGLLDHKSLQQPLNATLEHILSSTQEIFVKPAQLLQKQWRCVKTVQVSSKKGPSIGKVIFATSDARAAVCIVAHPAELDTRAEALDVLKISRVYQEIVAQTGSLILTLSDDQVFQPHHMDVWEEDKLIMTGSTDEDSASGILASLDLSDVQLLEAGSTIKMALKRWRALPAGQAPVSISVTGVQAKSNGCYLLPDRQRYTVFGLQDEDDDVGEDERMTDV